MFYRYEAIDRAGKTVMGTMDAPDESAVASRLTQMGFTTRAVHAPSAPTATQAKTITQRPTPAAQAAESKLPGAPAKELALFFRQFAALVRSGIHLYQALDNLAGRAGHASLAKTSREMAETAQVGGPISDVMEKYPRLYAPHVVGSVRAGELGGFLEIVLDEIALDYEQDVAFYKGLWLPKAMVWQGIVALAIAQPLFPTLFPEAQFGKYIMLVCLRNLPITAVILLAFRWWYLRMQQPEQRRRRDELALKVPVFGDLARQKSLASFVRMLRRLFSAGLAPITAWEGAMNVVPNMVIREKLVEAYGMMQKGVPVHETFINTGLFANETEQLLATGVISGQMVEMMDRVATYYQDNVDRAYEHSRHTMFKVGRVATIVLTGILLIMMFGTYFSGIFGSVAKMFPELNQ